MTADPFPSPVFRHHPNFQLAESDSTTLSTNFTVRIQHAATPLRSGVLYQIHVYDAHHTEMPPQKIDFLDPNNCQRRGSHGTEGCPSMASQVDDSDSSAGLHSFALFRQPVLENSTISRCPVAGCELSASPGSEKIDVERIISRHLDFLRTPLEEPP